MYRSNRSFNIPSPRPFDIFAVPGRREFDYQSLPGGGEFDPRVTEVGNLNCIHDFMWNLWRGELSWGTRCWGFSRKRLCLCGQLVTKKWVKQALCRIWRYLHFNIFNIGFWLLIWIILWPAASQWDFFYRTFCMLHDKKERKSEHSVTL